MYGPVEDLELRTWLLRRQKDPPRPRHLHAEGVVIDRRRFARGTPAVPEAMKGHGPGLDAVAAEGMDEGVALVLPAAEVDAEFHRPVGRAHHVEGIQDP